MMREEKRGQSNDRDDVTQDGDGCGDNGDDRG